MSSSTLDVPTCPNPAIRDEITCEMNQHIEHEALQEDLVTPDEAARIMSRIAGYEITSDDIRQLRRRKKIKAAKQTSRMTWYERSEVEKAKPPRKRNRKLVEVTGHPLHLDEKVGRREQIADPREERIFQIEIQKIELEKWRLALEERRLALEERRLALEERRLALEEKQLQNKLTKQAS